jgi:glycosyltransferase involved in cell wall biosynthesis
LENLGGVNQVVIGLAREMQRSGAYEPIVLIADWQAVRPVWEDSHGLRTVRWRIRSCLPGADLKERLAYMAWRWRFAKEFRQFCADHAVAAVNPHYPGPSVFALLDVIRGMRTRRPGLLLSFHGADLTNLEASPPALKAMWQSTLPHVAAVVACSRSLGHKLTAFFGPALQPQVVYNGLATHDFAKLRTGHGTAVGTRTILNVGKFEDKKGQDVLIRAFAALADQHPGLRLSLVGAVADALQALQALCAHLNLADRIDFHVNVPHADMAAHFQQAAIFVLPSRVEPFGIVLLEAGAFSLPVVASRAGGIPEIIEDGATGVLVPPDDVPGLARAIHGLLNDAPRAMALGRRLHARVVTEFTWETACRRYAALAGHVRDDNVHG